MAVWRSLAPVVACIAALAISAPPAQACACCANQGQRHVGVGKLEGGLREEIGRLRFLAEAELYTGEAEPADVKGIATPSSHYELHVAQEDSRWTFAFHDKGGRDKTGRDKGGRDKGGRDKTGRDKAGRSGTLILAIPDTVAIFAVDPRNDEREGGTGPALYKEWRLTSAAAGSGIFAPGMGRGQRLTLVLHAHGNNCTSADMASHWTLMVHGPRAAYHLFGKIVQP
jgi:hypothetical protein